MLKSKPVNIHNKAVTIFLTIALVLVYTSVLGHNLDIDILKVVNLDRNTSFDWLFEFVSAVAFPVAWGIPFMMLMTAYRIRKKTLLKKGWFMAGSLLFSALVVNVLKYTIERPRPFISYPFIEKLSAGGSPSFPSGHTSDAMTMAMALSILYPRWYVIIPSILWAGLVGYSRMDLGVHYPSDVLAGAIVGIGSSILIYKVFRNYSVKMDRHVCH